MKELWKRKEIKVFVLIVFIGVFFCILGIIVQGNIKDREKNVHISLAQKYLDELDYEQAIAEYMLALTIAPEDQAVKDALVDVYMDYGLSYVEKGDYSLAIEILQKGYDVLQAEALETKIAELKKIDIYKWELTRIYREKNWIWTFEDVTLEGENDDSYLFKVSFCKPYANGACRVQVDKKSEIGVVIEHAGIPEKTAFVKVDSDLGNQYNLACTEEVKRQKQDMMNRAKQIREEIVGQIATYIEANWDEYLLGNVEKYGDYEVYLDGDYISYYDDYGFASMYAYYVDKRGEYYTYYRFEAIIRPKEGIATIEGTNWDNGEVIFRLEELPMILSIP